MFSTILFFLLSQCEASEIGTDRWGTPDIIEGKEQNLEGKERGGGTWESHENKKQEDMASDPGFRINS